MAETERMTVTAINITPIKGLGLLHPDAVELTANGVDENRRFYLRSDGRLYNGKDCGPLVRIVPRLNGDRLALEFPDESVVDGAIELGAAVETDFWGRPVTGRVVEGPWAEALSAYAGPEIQLVRTDEPGTGIDVEVGTILGLGSCERLAEQLGEAVDPRRFRMLFELDGLEPYEEDSWEGRRLQIGDAILVGGGPVPRCAVTTQDPDTGVVSLDTLRAIRDLRGLRDNRYLDLGVYFDVERPGRVALGDSVTLL
jgi:hypothetical protein